jgi:hypothetical protein
MWFKAGRPVVEIGRAQDVEVAVSFKPLDIEFRCPRVDGEQCSEALFLRTS